MSSFENSDNQNEALFFENLKEANSKLDAVIESSFDGIYITDGDANTVKVNKAYESITGLKREDVLNKNMRDLVKDNILSTSGSLLVLEQRKPVTLFQEFQTGKKALITSSPVFNDNQEIIMVVTNVRDLTEIYELKEEIKQNKHQEKKLSSELALIKQKMKSSDTMVAVDENTLSVLHLANKVSALDTTVMLLGETGVGKELFADYIHQNSPRSKQPFIKVNCGSIPPGLIEAELFGYEKGAFTGADTRGKMGLFELADKGTLFLDEIGELPLEIQVKLLRVLQDQTFKRIGGTIPIKVDVRILAATNRNLEDMAAKKQFRQDLYYRLAVFPIHIPPLCERPDDIIPLLELFTSRFNQKYHFNKEFSPFAKQILFEYNWPGNVRELKNIVEQAIIISSNDSITSIELPIKSGPDFSKDNGTSRSLKQIIDQIEYQYLQDAYEEYQNVRDAAASLGMDPSTFVRKRKRYEKNHPV